jgi:HD-like signal output (HDOD) protein
VPSQITPPQTAPTLDLRATALQAVDRLPLFSVVLKHALELFSAGDGLSFAALADTIEQDVVIAGNILAVANSALYGRHGAAVSVRAAIARLGTHKTRNALLGLSIAKAFRSVKIPGKWSSARFNAHSLATATLSDLLVQHKLVADSEWAFTAGLLHDVGLLLIGAGLPSQFLALQDSAIADHQLVHHERKLLGFTHFDLSADLLASWNCPPSVQEAARFCERPSFEYCAPFSLGAAVKTASLLADADGLRTFPSNQAHSSMLELSAALDLGNPNEFVAAFELDFSGLQACAAA